MAKAFIAIALLTAATPAVFAQAPSPDIPTLAQALDRCMATYAVRLTKTEMADEAIFLAATEGCKQIDADLMAVVRREIRSAQGEAAIAQWNAQAKPNFMKLLTRIRTDRAARSGQ